MGMTEVEALPEHWAAGCSNAKQWVNCPDSKNAVDLREPGKAALIGTLGHKIVEQLLRGETVTLTADDQELIDEMSGEDEFDGYDKQAFADAIMLCYNYIRDIMDDLDFNDGDEIHFETKILSDKIGNHGGTVDVIVYRARTQELQIADFKFGRVPVESGKNYQVGAYINLARQLFPEAVTFTGTIVQPAYCGVSTSDYSAEWLDEFVLDAAVAADPENHERVAGAEWCEWCPMLPTCKTAAAMGRQAAHGFKPIDEKLNANEPLTEAEVHDLELIIIVDKITKKQLAGATALLKDAARQGAKLEFHRITQTARRSWKDDAEEFATELVKGGDIDSADLFVRNLRTPAQVRDLLSYPQEEFDTKFAVMLDCTKSPTLRAGPKPAATDLKEFEPVID
jgi:hypothetical protein